MKQRAPGLRLVVRNPSPALSPRVFSPTPKTVSTHPLAQDNALEDFIFSELNCRAVIGNNHVRVRNYAIAFAYHYEFHEPALEE